jgi:hypothetical protein
MPTQNPALRLVRRYIEYVPVDQVLMLPRGLRGIYVLYQREPARRRGARDCYSVVYVGMARQGGIRPRLRSHRKTKKAKWAHFSVFEVWPNISDGEVAELEGLFRHVYRHDAVASSLNKRRSQG